MECMKEKGEREVIEEEEERVVSRMVAVSSSEAGHVLLPPVPSHIPSQSNITPKSSSFVSEETSSVQTDDGDNDSIEREDIVEKNEGKDEIFEKKEGQEEDNIIDFNKETEEEKGEEEGVEERGQEEEVGGAVEETIEEKLYPCHEEILEYLKLDEYTEKRFTSVPITIDEAIKEEQDEEEKGYLVKINRDSLRPSLLENEGMNDVFANDVFFEMIKRCRNSMISLSEKRCFLYELRASANEIIEKKLWTIHDMGTGRLIENESQIHRHTFPKIGPKKCADFVIVDPPPPRKDPKDTAGAPLSRRAECDPEALSELSGILSDFRIELGDGLPAASFEYHTALTLAHSYISQGIDFRFPKYFLQWLSDDSSSPDPPVSYCGCRPCFCGVSHDFSVTDVEWLRNVLEILFFFKRCSIDQETRQDEVQDKESPAFGIDEGSETFSLALVQMIRKASAAFSLLSGDRGRLFLVRRLAECKGVAKWGGDLLQVPLPPEFSLQEEADSHKHCCRRSSLDLQRMSWEEHVLELLRIILRPLIVSASENPRSIPLKSGSPDITLSGDWVILSASLENGGLSFNDTDDRVSKQQNTQNSSDYLLDEDDFIALYEQIPLGSFFKRFFSPTDSKESNSESAFQAFSLGHRLVHLASTATLTFHRCEKVNEKGEKVDSKNYFSMVISKTVVRLLQAASQAGRGGSPLFDLLFLKVLSTLLPHGARDDCRCTVRGGWQFLADLPYHSLSRESASTAAKLLFSGGNLSLNYRDPHTSPKMLACEDDLIGGGSGRRLFREFLISVGDESVFLLLSLSSIASSFSTEPFSTSILIELFLVSHFAPHFSPSISQLPLDTVPKEPEIQHLYQKTVTQIIDAACSSSSKFASTLLHLIDSYLPTSLSRDQQTESWFLDAIATLKLCNSIDLSHWIPHYRGPEFDLLRKWLVLSKLGSLENSIGMVVSSKLNMKRVHRFQNGEQALVLGPKFHRRFALLLVEAQNSQCVRNTESNSSPSPPEFDKWCWNVLLTTQHFTQSGYRELEPIQTTDPSAAELRCNPQQERGFLNRDDDGQSQGLCFGCELTHSSPHRIFCLLELTELGRSFHFSKDSAEAVLNLSSRRVFDAVIRLSQDLLPISALEFVQGAKTPHQIHTEFFFSLGFALLLSGSLVNPPSSDRYLGSVVRNLFDSFLHQVGIVGALLRNPKPPSREAQLLGDIVGEHIFPILSRRKPTPEDLPETKSLKVRIEMCRFWARVLFFHSFHANHKLPPYYSLNHRCESAEDLKGGFGELLGQTIPLDKLPCCWECGEISSDHLFVLDRLSHFSLCADLSLDRSPPVMETRLWEPGIQGPFSDSLFHTFRSVKENFLQQHHRNHFFDSHSVLENIKILASHYPWCLFYILCEQTSEEFQKGDFKTLHEAFLSSNKGPIWGGGKLDDFRLHSKLSKDIDTFSIYYWAFASTSLSLHGLQHHSEGICSILPLFWGQFFRLFFLRAGPHFFGREFIFGRKKRCKIAKQCSLSIFDCLRRLVAHYRDLEVTPPQSKLLPDEESKSFPQLSSLYNAMLLWFGEKDLSSMIGRIEIQKREGVNPTGKDDFLPSLLNSLMNPANGNLSQIWEIVCPLLAKQGSIGQVCSSPSSSNGIHREHIPGTDRGKARSTSIVLAEDKAAHHPRFPSQFGSVPTPRKISASELSAIICDIASETNSFANVFQKCRDSHFMLDQEYLKGLPALYLNTTSTVAVQVPCSRGSLCKGPAKFLYAVEETRPDETVLTSLKKNRQSLKQLMITGLPTVEPKLHPYSAYAERGIIHASLSFVDAKLCCQQLIKMMKNWLSTQGRDPDLGPTIESAALSAFYATLALNSNTNNGPEYFNSIPSYPPSCILIREIISSLGREFTSGNPHESSRLLSIALSSFPSPHHPDFNNASLITPFFDPAAAAIVSGDFTEFPALYEKVIRTHNTLCSGGSSPSSLSDIILILRQFNVRKWLNSLGQLGDDSKPFEDGDEMDDLCASFLNLVASALSLKGSHIDEPELHHDILKEYSVVFESLAGRRFPSNATEILQLLKTGSEDLSISPLAWKVISDLRASTCPTAPSIIEEEAKLLSEFLNSLSSSDSSPDPSVMTHRPVSHLFDLHIYFHEIMSYSSSIIRSPNLIPKYHYPVSSTPIALRCLEMLYTPWIHSASSYSLQYQAAEESPIPAIASSVFRCFVDDANFLQASFDSAAQWAFQMCCGTISRSPFIPMIPVEFANSLREAFHNLNYSDWRVDLNLLTEVTSYVKLFTERRDPEMILFIWDVITNVDWKNAARNTSMSTALMTLLLTLIREYRYPSHQHRLEQREQDPKFSSCPRFTSVESWLSFDWNVPQEDFISFVDSLPMFYVTRDGLLPPQQVDCVENLWFAVKMLICISVTSSSKPTNGALSSSDPWFDDEDSSISQPFSISKFHCLLQVIFRFVKKQFGSVEVTAAVDSSGILNVLLLALQEFSEKEKDTTNGPLDLTFGLCEELADFFNLASTLSVNVVRSSFFQCSSLSVGLLRGVCAVVLNQNIMALASEDCIEAYFSIHSDWEVIVDALRIPELDEQNYIGHCIQIGALFNLYARALQLLSVAQTNSSDALMHVVALMMQWNLNLNLMVVLKNGKESKILTFWAKIIQILFEHLTRFPNDQRQWRALVDFAHTLLKHGEDKKGGGLLGVLGLGERSPLSPPFRLSCKILGTFVLSQQKNDGSLRTPSQPSDIKKRPDSVKRIAALHVLLKNQDYLPYSEVVRSAIDFIDDPQNSLLQWNNLRFMVFSRLFPSEKYLW